MSLFSPPKTKILFIGHDASRSGAPILLLNLLRHFKNKNQFSIRILLRSTGPLEKYFSEIAPVKVFSLRGKILKKIINLLRLNWAVNKIRNQFLLNDYNSENFDLIYSNTIVNGDILKVLSKLKLPIITHVHELNNVIAHYGQNNWELIKRYTNYYIAGSLAVKENLALNRGIARGKIEVVHEFIPAFPAVSISDCRHGVREQLGIPLNAFVVCGSGLSGRRKGTDLFVQLAECVLRKKNDMDIFFLWVGRRLKNAKEKHDIDKFLDLHGLRSRVIFTGEVDNPLDYYAASDVFAMVSREDPFPLVCLLAASVGKPVLCFDGAGGMPEFVENDSGYVVPYLDVNTMAEKIVDLTNHPEELHRLGSCAQRKAQQKYDINVGAERILQIIDKVLKFS